MEETKPQLPLLGPEELRVLGALIEKSKTTPDYYPMTLNGLTAACNQKTSRNPVTDYDEPTVLLTLDELKKKGLAATVTGAGSRVVKYRHTLAVKYPLDLAETTLIGLLFLRGPQTAGELKTNAGRMYDFENLEETQNVLMALSGSEIPYVVQLPRKPGQKEIRFMHCFSGEPDPSEFEGIPEEPARRSVIELENRLQTVESELAELKEKVDKILRELF
jgi:uncharacterized protein YceH (UPF0502 family)